MITLENYFSDGSYKYRNVFKSIIRKMNTLTSRKTKQITSKLKELGYSSDTIEKTIQHIYECTEIERKNGIKKMAPNLIRSSTKTLSIYTHILKYSIQEMLSDWDAKEIGRLSQKNIELYKHLCKLCLDSADKLIKSKFQINSFISNNNL